MILRLAEIYKEPNVAARFEDGGGESHPGSAYWISDCGVWSLRDEQLRRAVGLSEESWSFALEAIRKAEAA